MKPIVAPVVADSKRLLRDVVSVCADFPQRLKFILSERLVALALDSVLRAQEAARAGKRRRSEEHTSELQSLMRISYAVFCLKKKKNRPTIEPDTNINQTTYINNKYTLIH